MFIDTDVLIYATRPSSSFHEWAKSALAVAASEPRMAISRQVHGANIVATMLAYGEDRLLTMNRSDFRRFEPRIEIVEP